MTYAETTDFLFNSLPVFEQAGAGAYKPGLERVREFAAAVLGGNGLNHGQTSPGSPSLPFRTIHVAGTNGKGSTSHMLAAVLQSAGYKTGLFTSPHLVDFRERIRVDGAMIPEAAVIEFTERHKNEMVRLGLTFFEMATVMALWWFARSGVDIAVIETGLGGRLDATNIITPLVSVITNIGLEHTQYLGDTIARIAAEKAGIIKPGIPVVIGETGPESEPVFRTRAAELGSPVIFADQTAAAAATVPPHNTPPFALDLAGDYQQKNLTTVLAVIDILHNTFEIPSDTLRDGLQNAAALTGLAGRWQIIRQHPLVVLDTAHNAHGLAEVMRQVKRQLAELRHTTPTAQLFMVLGFAGDKDFGAIIQLLPRGTHYILTQATTPRAMPAEELARRFASHGIPAEIAGTVPEAIRRALSQASEKDMIYIGGSNFVVGEALATLTDGDQTANC